MAKKIRMTDRSVRNLLDRLCDSGELVRDGHVDTPNGKVVKYRIVLTNAAKGQIPRKSFPGSESVDPGSVFPGTPEIAVSDKPSVNHQSLTTTHVVDAARPKVEEKEDDSNVLLGVQDDPSLHPVERASRLLVRYTAEKASQKRLGVVGEAFTVTFGHEPVYGRLNALRSKYGVGMLAETIYRLAGKDFVGDPMDYLTATLNKKGTGPGGWTPRIAWHPAGYRSEVPNDELTLSEIWIKIGGDSGIPHEIFDRKKKLETIHKHHKVYEFRAHLAYAKIAKPGWLGSTPGLKLIADYKTAKRLERDFTTDELWIAYCDKFVPEEWREQVKEIEVP
jgi:hypothetical protein